MDSGWVYFILDSAADPQVKVGYSTNVYQRLQILQTGNATHLKIYGLLPGTLKDESRAHKILALYCTRGEWFQFKKAKAYIDRWLTDGWIYDPGI